MDKCPECGSKHFYRDPEKAERVCAKCGLVMEESMVDTGQEWRAFDHDQKVKRARTGAPLTHKRLLTSKDRNMSFALSELQRLISFLGLPKTLHEEVAKLYEKALQKSLVRGRSIESIIAALVYSLSREYETPRT